MSRERTHRWGKAEKGSKRIDRDRDKESKWELSLGKKGAWQSQKCRKYFLVALGRI